MARDVAVGRLRRLMAGDTVPVLLLTAVITGLQGVLALLTARWLGAGGRGQLSIAQTVNTLAMMIGSVGLLQSVRIIIADPKTKVGVDNFIRATRLQTGLFVGLAALLAVTALPWFGQIDDPLAWVVWVVWLVALFRFSHLREVLHGMGKHRQTLLIEAVVTALGLAAVCVVRFVDGTISYLPISVVMAGTYLVGWATQAAWVKIASRGGTLLPRRRSWDVLREILRFSVPGLIAAAGLMVASRMDQLILAKLHGTAAVGVYAMASTLSDLAWGLPVAISGVLVRRARMADPARLPEMHAIAWRRIVGASTALCAVVAAIGFVLFRYFLGPDFAGAGHLVVILSVGSVAMASQQVDLAICGGLGDLRAAAHAALWGIAVGCVAYVVLITLFGVDGCAVANDLTFVAMAISARVSVRRHLARLSQGRGASD